MRCRGPSVPLRDPRTAIVRPDMGHDDLLLRHVGSVGADLSMAGRAPLLRVAVVGVGLGHGRRHPRTVDLDLTAVLVVNRHGSNRCHTAPAGVIRCCGMVVSSR